MSQALTTTSLAALCLLGPSAGCGSSSTSPAQIEGWLGPQIHFELHGRIAGRDVAISLGEADVDTTTLYAKRTWGVPDVEDYSTYDQGFFIEAEIRLKERLALQSFMEGVTRLEIELKAEKELISASPGTAIAVVPPDPVKLYEEYMTPGSLWLELELKNGDLKFYEEAAKDGSFTLHENSGTIASDGLTYEADTGRVGGFFHARWSVTEELTGSFTVPSARTSVDSVGRW